MMFKQLYRLQRYTFLHELPNVFNTFPDFDYASPILDFSIFRGQNRHFCPRLVSFEHQTKA